METSRILTQVALNDPNIIVASFKAGSKAPDLPAAQSQPQRTLKAIERETVFFFHNAPDSAGIGGCRVSLYHISRSTTQSFFKFHLHERNLPLPFVIFKSTPAAAVNPALLSSHH